MVPSKVSVGIVPLQLPESVKFLLKPTEAVALIIPLFTIFTSKSFVPVIV